MTLKTQLSGLSEVTSGGKNTPACRMLRKVQEGNPKAFIIFHLFHIAE